MRLKVRVGVKRPEIVYLIWELGGFGLRLVVSVLSLKRACLFWSGFRVSFHGISAMFC